MIQSEIRKKALDLVFKDMNLEALKEDKRFGRLYVNINFTFDGSPYFQEFVDYLDSMSYINTKLFDNYFEQYKIKDLNKFIEKNVIFNLKKITYKNTFDYDEKNLTRNDYCVKIKKESDSNNKLPARIYRYEVEIVLNPELDNKKKHINIQSLVPKLLKWTHLNDEMNIYY